MTRGVDFFPEFANVEVGREGKERYYDVYWEREKAQARPHILFRENGGEIRGKAIIRKREDERVGNLYDIDSLTPFFFFPFIFFIFSFRC